MSTRNAFAFATLLLSLVLLPAAPAFPQPAALASADDATSSAPLLFIENVGQFDARARFQVRGASETLWLAEDAIWITVVEEEEEKSGSGGEWEPLSQSHPRSPAHGVNIRLTFPGANPHPRLEPFDRLDTTVSYFTGSDPARWRSDVPVWSGVRYVDIYPGVDLEITGRNEHWTWRVTGRRSLADGAYHDLVLRVEGAEEVALDANHTRLQSGAGEYVLPLLGVDGMLAASAGVVPVEANTFDVVSPFVWPTLAESPKPERLPEDDPADLLYSTYLGGQGRDRGQDIVVDTNGYAYITGQTASSDFPTTPGAFDPTYNLSNDAFVVKLDATGGSLVYATYLGGNDWDEGYGIALDGSGNAHVAGWTWSDDFPTTPSAYDTSLNGDSDAFVAMLNADGTALTYATYLGASGSDSASTIAVDNDGHATIAGGTSSDDFPTTPGAFDPTPNGAGDSFVAQLTVDGSALVFSTLLGGSDSELALDIALDSLGQAIVVGAVWSDDFPTTPGAFDPTFNGSGPQYSGDAFVAKFNGNGSGLLFSTYLGGWSGDCDGGCALALDPQDTVFVTGVTSSPNFPTTPGAYSPSYNGGSIDGCCDAFVTRLNAAGTDLIYSTFLGAADVDGGSGIAVDQAGNATVSGNTTSVGFPTTPGAFDTSFNGQQFPDGDNNVFLARFNAEGSDLVYSTFLGIGRGWATAVDGANNAYLTGETDDPNFPTTPNAFDTTYNGGFNDAFVAKLNLDEPTGVGLAELAAGSPNQASGLALEVAVAVLLAVAGGLLLLAMARLHSGSASR